MRRWIALGMEVLGGLALALGAALVYPPAGILLAGVLAILFGLAMERE
jgi:hypothetical protein